MMDSQKIHGSAPVGGDELSTTNQETVDLSQVQIEKVIDDSNMTKMITFQGIYKAKPIIIRLEKTMFVESTTKQSITDSQTKMDLSFLNDIYSSYIMTPALSDESLSQIQATIIWPANEKALAKYTHIDKIFFSETYGDFKNIVGPYIENMLSSDENYNNWVYNILEGRSEVERVIYNDIDRETGFLITPDLKWSDSMEDVYLLAICHRRDIRCLRDLNSTHLPLLNNILNMGTKIIEEKFSRCKGQLRSYVHYHPSFYHFHVHFKFVDAGNYQSTDRDNLLTTVINNISLMNDYYAKSTLTYPLSKSNALYEELKRVGRLTK